MISLLQLDYFRRLCRTQHITQTAKELYISQTALSSMIIGLEKELGVKLFDRSGRSIKLNCAGEIYAKYVNEALSALENGQRALQDLRDTGANEVSLAMGTSLVWLPMIRDFHSRYPQYTIKQTGSDLAGLRSRLETMEVDFVISGLEDIPHNDLNWTFIREDRVYLCVPENHPFAQRESVCMEDLRDKPFISLPSNIPWQKFCDGLFDQAGFPCKTVLECDYSLRSSLIASNFGIALTSSSGRDVDLLKPNRYVPVSDSFARRTMVLLWNPKKYLSSVAIQFREFCSTYYQQENTDPDDASLREGAPDQEK